jgi:S-disulfanyl-L-cysteine oxidoreductase SoxD
VNGNIWHRLYRSIGLISSTRVAPSKRTLALRLAPLPLLIAITIFCGQLIARAQQSPDQASVWDGVYTEAQAKRGQALYSQNCSRCHGATLTEGEEAPALAGGTFLANWGGLTVGDLFERMRTTMPQDDPGKLSSQQYADILAFVLSGNEFPAGKTEVGTHAEMLKMIQIDPNKPASKEAPAAVAKAGQDAGTAGDAGKGKQLFAKVGCANCHGASAEGGAGPKIAPPPIALPEFLKFVRKPTGEMTPFSQDQVSDTGLTDIYAFLQSISPAPKATR